MKVPHVLILGNGQLGNLLAAACLKLRVLHSMFALNDTETSFTAVREIKNQNPLMPIKAVVESETVPLSSLQKLQELGVLVFPNLNTFGQWRNKALQKKNFRLLNLPTSPFYTVQELAPLTLDDCTQTALVALWHQAMNKALQIWPTGFVLKIGEGGYDGKGVWKVNSNSSLNLLQEVVFKNFKEADAEHFWQSLYVEALCPFSCELALQAVRNAQNEIYFYPLVLSEQKESICNVVEFSQENLWPGLEKQAQDCARVLAEHFDYVGLFAIEFFLHPEQGLWINEIAPRVHNSGHHTLDTFNVSQFEAHIQAVCDIPLLPLKPKYPAGLMFNLIGQTDMTMESSQKLARELKSFDWPAHFQLYWYDKTPVRKGRKMGHLNGVGKNLKELRQQAEPLMERLWLQKQK